MIASHLPGLFPEYINIYGINISQTLLTSFLSLIFFIIFVVIYNFLKNKNESNFLVIITDLFVETIDKFFGQVSEKIPTTAKAYVLFLFVYILWNNLFGLILDIFATVVPFLHHNFRTVTTDIYFNAALAIIGVIRAIAYGFKINGFRFIERYISIKGFGIAGKKPDSFGKVPLRLIIKGLDILLSMFIGFLEFVGEFTKILSLTLRLFGNIFAGMVLLIIVVAGTIALLKIPLIAPIIVVVMELLESVLQAFVFALLVLIYFKIAEEAH